MKFDRRGAIGAGLGLAATMTLGNAKGLVSAPVVETAKGRLRGLMDRGAINFRGIPYGATTAGANRFRAPQPVESWIGVRDATRFPNQSPQGGARERPSAMPLYDVWASYEAREPMSEDCLGLNVWTPSLDGARPVMVWLHPGGFQTGAGAEPPTNGAHLALHGDVVLVSVNHRLGALGYSYFNSWTNSLRAEDANPGQLDIIAALGWVRDNIANFGGDPGNVTIFGQSGGGAKVCSLLATPKAKGLFHKAICQSGSYIELTPTALSARGAAALAKALRLPDGNLAALQRVPALALSHAATALAEGEFFRCTDPVRDGVIMPFDPFSTEAIALSADIPLMIGSTATEATSLNHDPESFDLDWARLKAKWLQPYETASGQTSIASSEADRQIAAFRRAYPAASPSDLYFRFSSDVWTILNAITIADRQSRGARAPVFMYELAFQTSVDGGRWRSPHSLDVPLIFRNIANAPSMLPDEPRAHRVSEQMSAAWAAFAHHGDPNHGGIPQWPRWDDKRRPAMVFDVVSHVADDYRKDDRQILAGTPTLRV